MAETRQIQSHELTLLDPPLGSNTYKGRCSCGWARVSENELLLAILHQSHMLEAHEQRRLNLEGKHG